MLRAAIPLVLLMHGCCGTPFGDSCGPSGPPPPDSCNAPESGTLATIVIGGDADLFSPYHDGDNPHIIRGGQGAQMMGIRLKLTGTVPACLKQNTSYQDNAAQGHSDSPVKTYPESDGSYTTKALWIPGYFPSGFSVVVEAGGKSERVRLGTPTDMYSGM